MERPIPTLLKALGQVYLRKGMKWYYPSAFQSTGIGLSPFPYRVTLSQRQDRSFSIREWRDLSQHFWKRWNFFFFFKSAGTSLSIPLWRYSSAFKSAGIGLSIPLWREAYPSAFKSARIGLSISIFLINSNINSSNYK